jgi:tetratricopeptide (TPR) repeat protein
LAPRDARIHNRLGLALMYRNFFRAASGHFEQVLRLDPRDATALYFLAFIANCAGSADEARAAAARWQAVSGSRTPIDFQSAYERFHFQGATMREWFSENPLELFRNPVAAYRFRSGDRLYDFGEVPLEIGRYLVRHGKAESAARCLQDSFRLNSDAPGVEELRDQIRRARPVASPANEHG